MSYIINKLYFDDTTYKFISSDNRELEYLDNLGKLNIFIGQNNSGKSLLMRMILLNENLRFLPSDDSVRLLNSSLETKIFDSTVIDFLNDAVSDINKYENENIEELFNEVLEKIQKFPKIIYLKQNDNYFINYYNDLINSIYANSKKPKVYNMHGYEVCSEDWISLEAYIKNSFGEINVSELNLDFNFKKVYIPILRGILPLINSNEIVSEDIYKNRIKNDYFKENDTVDIFSGLNIFHEIKRNLLGNLKQRDSIKHFEEFLSKNFFNNESVTLIPSLNEEGHDDVLTIKIGNEKEQPVYNLGDGIQSIIIITFPLFKYLENIKDNENVLYFIEEPELYLHPGMQRILIETLLSDERFDKFQFFITTHSNHFLDLSLDYDNVSIFSFNKTIDDLGNVEVLPSFKIENKFDNSIFDLLGIKPSSLLFTNCSIWVEGKYDRLFFKHCLKLYKEEYGLNYIEGHHYAFFQYNGDDINFWSNDFDSSEQLNINNFFRDIYVIHDDDNDDKIHKKINENIGENYYKLNVLELENLVKKSILEKIISSYCIDFETNFNFEEKDYANIKIGDFIFNVILNGNDVEGLVNLKNKKIKFNKKVFNKKLILFTESWDDLSDEAKNITKRIINFIKKING